MTCCAPTSSNLEGTNQFFNTQARRMEKYFRKKGLRKEQRYLVEGIRRNGIDHGKILEIGCGVGGLHLSLLKDGAGQATGFDISEKMIETARRLAAEMGLQERTQYWQGDFVARHDQAPLADITILDKVICCYENVSALIAYSAGKTRRIYAVSYPRESALVRRVMQASIFFLKLFRMPFHPYYHPPEQIQKWIIAEGFEKIYEQETFIWLIQVYQRRR
ncbi:MAG: methyltransferase domain-containing protein [candidate division KSB1 bacterium]|nr:methyltransferase domain-containing protein [candidate division KSB1 bacterium]